MAIPSHKLAILFSGLKPKGAAPEGDDDHEDEDGDDGYGEKLDDCIDSLADAIVGGDKDAIKGALHELHDCMVEEDEEQDSKE